MSLLIDSCEFKIAEFNKRTQRMDERRCTETKVCQICNNCLGHCVEHSLLRPHIKAQAARIGG